MRYLAIVQYKGTNYCGWQKQTISKLPSIQEEIERTLSKILNNDTKIYGSGRTDAGVHALGQTFHFDTDKELDSYRFLHGVNELLPDDIILLSINKVENDFHARFKAERKTYLYKIYNDLHPNPFYLNLALQMSQKLDVVLMKEASKIFLGEHNFQNFTSKEEDEAGFIRCISKIDISIDNNFINIELTGNGFMRYMVRMIVGNLIQVGLGKMSILEIKKCLDSKVRKPSSYKIKADGLYLKEVCYNN